MHAPLGFLMLHLLLSQGPNALGDTIINGGKVPDNLMLYMASVQLNGHHQCGGFLITEDFVLTAAHCDKENLTVVLGTHNLKKVQNDMRYHVCRIKHPDFRGAKFGNDIMLLKLHKKVPRKNTIQQIRIPKTKKTFKSNTKCCVAGWGATKTGGQPATELQAVDVDVDNTEECRREWKKYRKVDLAKDAICAGGQTKEGFCQGDSGGPLVCGGEAVGIVSFNMDKNCNYPNLPNIYVDISKHLKWIKQVQKGKRSVSCEKSTYF